MTEKFDSLVRAGEIHKKVQEYIKTDLLKPNINLFQLATSIEDKIKELTYFDSTKPKQAGVAFPTGLSINECAAHWSPNLGNKTEKLSIDDLLKIDFGVHINGHIVDGAFSNSFSEKFEVIHQGLIEISQEATECGINNAGPDAILGEIGESIQEIIESHEIAGKKVLSTIDLCGHNIGCYRIHNGKSVPNVKMPDFDRMKVGEEFAIETFPTNGSGKVKTIDQIHESQKSYYVNSSNPPECSHYMIEKYNKHILKRVPKNLVDSYKSIYSNFNTLAFCKRWLPDVKINSPTSETELQRLVNKGCIQQYPPLYDVKGSFVAQTEKSIYITEEGKVILN